MFSVYNLPAIIAASIIKESAMVSQTLVYNSAADFSGNTSTFTTTALPIGAASPNRWVVVGIFGNYNTADSLASVTIGGVSATLVRGFPHITSNGSRLEFWKANVPTGTTAVITFTTTSGAIWDGTLGVWSASAEPFFYSAAFTRTLSGGSFSTVIDVPNGGAVIGLSNNAGGSIPVLSTTGIALDFTGTPYRIAGGSEDLLSAQIGRTVTIARTTGGNVAGFIGLGAVSLSFDNSVFPLTYYNSTQADQTYIVPAGVSMLYAGLAGAGAGSGSYSSNTYSGAGGYTYVEIPVTAGDILLLQVGQGGQEAVPSGAAASGVGGWPDGGSGTYGDGPGGGGGGSSRIWLNGVLIAVAGAGGADAGYTGNGGAGGGLTGQACSNGAGGTGGTQSDGGFDASEPASVPKKGLQITSATPTRTGGWGGASQSTTVSTGDDGGGGGGGYWGGGGGGGDGQGAGGGSGYIHPSYVGATYVGNGVNPPSKLTNNPYYPPLIAIGRRAGATRTRGGHGLIILSTSPSIFV